MPGALDAGQIVDDRYALEEHIGEDALGTIWRAHDRGLDRDIVLRSVRFPGDVFREDPNRRAAALYAGRQAIKVDHPRAVHVYDAFIDGIDDAAELVMVTEIADGRPLASLVEKRPLPAKRVAGIGLDVLEALAAAHAIGVVHGAVSPNVVLVPERGHARLGGFGLAPAFRDASSTRWIDAAGTPACIAPEQANLQGSGEASDLWALGASLYYAVEGVHAFSDSTVVGTPRPAERAGELGPILERLLAREPRERPSVEVVRAVLTEISGVAKEEAEAFAAPPKRRSRKERARTAPEPVPEPEAEAQADELAPQPPADDGRDWSSVIEAEETWVDWPTGSALDASDVWLPGTDNLDMAPEARDMAPEARDMAPEARDMAPEARDMAPEAPESAAEAPVEADPGEHAPLAAVRPIQPPGTHVAEEDEEPPRRYRSTPSWPPPPKRRIGVTILCTAVSAVMLLLLFTEGRLGRPKTTTNAPANQRPVLASDPAAVPGDWITWSHPAVPDFGLSYPPGWSLREEGSLVTIQDPSSGAELRVDYKQPPGADPVRSWEDLERGFTGQHPNDYKRLQLSPANFLGHVAALWEFTYLQNPSAQNSAAVHAVDVGFLSKKYGFALYFEAPANTWSNMLPTFHAFLGSIRAPK